MVTWELEVGEQGRAGEGVEWEAVLGAVQRAACTPGQGEEAGGVNEAHSLPSFIPPPTPSATGRLWRPHCAGI